ncbi:MAG: adenylate/guanylate cyclase domain-containing protein [Rhizobiaceae bacterium]
MVVDMVGYSAMMDNNQEAAIEAIRELKNTHLEPVLGEFEGEILKRMGDGWIVAFSSISAALDSAVKVQTELYDHPNIKLRIGCHLGEIIEEDDDFYGAGVNITQRIQTEAPPGGVMVSEDFYRQLSSDFATDLSDAGTFNLKNISQPVRLFQWRPPAVAKGKLGSVPSIAVQTFDFAPVDAETEALAGDLRDQLIVRLSRRKGVTVFDSSAKSIADAIYDLRGRVRLAGGRGRFTVTLVLRDDARPVWSQTYEALTDDIFAFCDYVLEQAEGDLRLQNNAFDGDRLIDLPIEALSISELRARAANDFYKVTMESWKTALEIVERAISLNPQDGMSLSMRAEAQLMLYGACYKPFPRELAGLYLDDLDNAVIQLPQSDYVFWVRGNFRLAVNDDVAGARSDLERGRQVNPAYLEYHELEAQILLREAEFSGAEAAFTRLIERGAKDPLQPYRLFMRGVGRFCGGDFKGAEQDASAAFDLRPNERGHLILRAMALDEMKSKDMAKECLSTAGRLPKVPTMTTKPPVLPPDYRWVLERLAPGG